MNYVVNLLGLAKCTWIGLIFVLGTACIPGGIIPLVCDVILWLNAITSHSPPPPLSPFLPNQNIIANPLSAFLLIQNAARPHGRQIVKFSLSAATFC